MYKDVWKRILAMMVTICLVVTLVEWPTTVKAESGKIYHTYQYGGSEDAGTVAAKTASAVFMTGQNSKEGAEIFESVSFDIHIEESANQNQTMATVEIYSSPNQGDPGSGVFLCSNEVISLVEGTNEVSFASASPKLMKGECFSVLVTLKGEGISFYTDVFDQSQRTFVMQEDGSWEDMAVSGQSVTIRAVTSDEPEDDTEKAGFLQRVASVLSPENISDGNGTTNGAQTTEVVPETEGAAEQNGGAGIDGTEMQDAADTDGSNSTELKDAADTGESNTTEINNEDNTNETNGSNAIKNSGDGINKAVTDEAVTNEGLALAALELDHSAVTIATGENVKLSILNPDLTKNYVWTVADGAVVSVTENGAPAISADITGLQAGSTVLTVIEKDTAGAELAKAECSINVKQSIGDFTIQLSENSFVYDGTEKKPSVTVYDGAKELSYTTDYLLDYINYVNASTEENPAQVTVIGQNDYAGKSDSINYTIMPKDINQVSDIAVDVIQEGEDVASKITLTDTIETLVQDTHYTLTLDENAASSGRHTVVITGIGNYCGSKELEYTVVQDISKAVITVAEGPYVYTGKEIHPEVSVSVDGVALRPENYKVTYPVCTNAGEGKIVVEGIGDYFGKVENLTFTILKKDITNKDNTPSRVDIKPYPLPIAARKATAEESIPQFTVEYNGITLARGTDASADYIIKSVTLAGGGDITTATAATLKLEGQGNYTGERELTYSIGSDIGTVVSSVTVSAPTAEFTGELITPGVTVTPVSGVTLTEGTDYTVTFEDNRNTGTAHVTVRGIGLYGGFFDDDGDGYSATFEITPTDISKMDNSSFKYDNDVVYSPNAEDMKPDVSEITFHGNALTEDDVTISYEYPDTSGVPTVGKAAYVVITGKGGNYTGSKQLPYTISACPIDSSEIKVTMQRDYVFTGNPVDLELKLEYIGKAGTSIAELTDSDYEIVLSDRTSTGTKTVLLKGKGNYSGVREEKITISKIVINTLSLTITKNADDVSGYDGGYKAVKRYADGKAVTLDLKLEYKEPGGTTITLIENRDYTLNYFNNKQMSKLGSTAEVVIEGKGDYGGSMTVPFLIAKDISDCDVSGIPNSTTYTGDLITFSDLSVKDGNILGTTLVKDIDFIAEYEDNENVTTGAALAKVTIRSVGNKQIPTQNGCYVGEQEKTFAINPLDFSDIDESKLSVLVAEKYYNGTPVTLTADDITAQYTTPSGAIKTLGAADYTILDTYNKNNQVTKEATAYIEGQGNFKGTRKVLFEILGKSIKDLTVTLDKEEWDYTGSQVKPTVTIMDGSYKLVENTDYKLAYENNTKAGDASIVVTGIGSYAGEVKVGFKISPLKLSANGNTTTISGVSAAYTYLPTGISPEPVVRFTKNGSTNVQQLTKDIDYTVSYVDHEKAGAAKVVVTGKGNYSGSVEQGFTIDPKEITSDMIADIEPQPFTGKDVCPAVTITYEGTALTEGTDFTVVYENNFSVGDNAAAKITAKPNGNYTGSAEKKFRITNSIIDSSIIISCEDAGKKIVYTGEEIRPKVTVKSNASGNLIEGTDYTVEYKNNLNAGAENLAAVIVTGIGKYSGSKEFHFTVAPKDIGDSDVTAAFADNKNSYEYTGAQIAPAITMTYGALILNSAGANDYTATYGENINAGTGAGSVDIKATGGNYVGTKTLYFDITARSIGSGTAFATGFSMDAIVAQGYTGSPICPTPEVHYQGKNGTVTSLVYGNDYTFEYENNTNIGTAEIKVVAAGGNYTGSVSRTFEIKGSIAGAQITMGDVAYEDWADTGKVTPLPTVVLDGKTLRKGTDYTVSYEDNDFVGEAKVIITGAGNYGGQVSKNFKILGDMEKVTVDAIDDRPFTGSAITPEPIVKYHDKALKGGGIDYTVSYSGNTDIGTATITLTGNEYFEYGVKIVTFQIIPSSGNFIIEEIAPYKYTGSQIKPDKITVRFGSLTLDENTDYKLSYGDNTDAGTGTVTVTGMNSYKDIKPVTRTFAINPLDVNELTIKDSEDAGPFGGIASREYTGAPIIPDIQLAYQVDGKTVYTLKNSDFAISCPAGNNIERGTADIEISGKGNNVIGTRQESFAIVERDIVNVSVSIAGGSNQTYTGEAVCPKITVKDAGGLKTLTENADYLVDYDNNINAGKTGSAEIKIKGINNYSGDRVVPFTILPLNITAATVADIPSVPYAGVPVTPSVTVTYQTPGGTEMILAEKTDYTLSYQNNTAAGNEAKAVVTGKGNFTGSTVKNFSIIGHDINAEDVIVADIPNQAYTGEKVTPSLAITCGEYKLERDQDYKVMYDNNVEIGTATVTITGIGNFSGERSATFEIASGIESAQITGLLASYPYTGAAIEPTGIVVKIGETILNQGTDYAITYRDNTDAGTGVLIVTGAGVYGGQKEFTFKITPKNLGDEDIVLNGFADTLLYTGEAVTQNNMTLMYGDCVLETPEDYTVQYTGNTAIGTANMIITGSGKNYTGSIEKSFTITQNVIIDGNLDISNMSSTYTYTGEEIRPVPELRINGALLIEGTDYELSFENNIKAGVAKMTVTGMTNYSGTKEVNFTILRKSILMGTFGQIGTQTYTGEDIKPAVAVSDNGKNLMDQVDYNLMYSNNRKAGTATAIIAGKGNYTATKVLRFDIRPGDVSSLAMIGSTNSSVSISWSGSGTVTGYEIYRAGADGKYQRVSRKKGTTFTDTKLTAGGTYSYKVRAYLVTESDTYYGAFSPVVTGTT